MTTLRERLAQMGEVALAARFHTGGTGRWTCERERKDGTAQVYAPSMGSLRQIMPIAETMGVYGKHIATFSPDVAAALVAVADAAARNQEPTSTEAAPDADMVSLGTIIGDRDAALDRALDALAAALGVSR